MNSPRCSECKHGRQMISYTVPMGGECSRPHQVTGFRNLTSCERERESKKASDCGPKARFYEPKPEPGPVIEPVSNGWIMTPLRSLMGRRS